MGLGDESRIRLWGGVILAARAKTKLECGAKNTANFRPRTYNIVVILKGGLDEKAVPRKHLAHRPQRGWLGFGG